MGCKNFFQKIIGFFIAILVAIGIMAQPTPTPAPEEPPTAVVATPDPTEENTPTQTAEETEEDEFEEGGTISESDFTPTPEITRPAPGSVCPYDAQVAKVFEAMDQDQWILWLETLSGERPVTIEKETFTIQTRYTENMFAGDPDARAYELLLYTVREWGFTFGETLFEHTYKPGLGQDVPTWKNLIVVLPGTDPQLAEEQVLLTAHLDSTSYEPEERAPGADDNASGVATLIEAIRVLKTMSFKRTIKIIFFTGEEIGLKGSTAYTAHYGDTLDQVVGVINLDMFGYDADNDMCFEMHVGELPASNQVGGCLADTIEIYDLGLKFEYLIDDARGYSDHASFWNAGVGAIEVLENFSTHTIENGCGEADVNPHYHTDGDLVSAMNLDTAFRIAQAAVAAAARLAEPTQ